MNQMRRCGGVPKRCAVVLLVMLENGPAIDFWRAMGSIAGAGTFLLSD